MYIPSVYPTPPEQPPQNFFSYLCQVFEQNGLGDHVMLVDGSTGEERMRSECMARIHDAAIAFVDKLSLSSSHRVAILSDNCLVRKPRFIDELGYPSYCRITKPWCLLCWPSRLLLFQFPRTLLHENCLKVSLNPAPPIYLCMPTCFTVFSKFLALISFLRKTSLSLRAKVPWGMLLWTRSSATHERIKSLIVDPLRLEKTPWLISCFLAGLLVSQNVT